MKEEINAGVPAWLSSLLGELFFSTCYEHQEFKRSEKNIFCLLCCSQICHNCIPSHPSHPLLQIRRYVYHDVVKMEDIEKLVDCSYVQPYTINRSKVMFLKSRPHSRFGSGRNCLTCDRLLHDPFRFCSLSCKVEHVVFQGGLSGIIYRVDLSDQATLAQFKDLRVEVGDGDEDEQITPSSILEAAMHFRGSSCSASSSTRDESETVVKKKKGGGSELVPKFMLSLNRRKGAPQRAPFA